MACRIGFRVVLIALFMPSMISAEEKKEDEKPKVKPRELFEMAAETKTDPGISLFYEGNMEPTGVVCVGYVKKGSPNHKLLKKMGAVTKEDDEELYDLTMTMAAAIDWEEEESLQLHKRVYAQTLWDSLELPPLDTEPVTFPSKPGKLWKEKEVRQWLLDNGYPAFNYRILGYNQKKDRWPFDKYFGKANKNGVALALVHLGKDWDFEPQFRAARRLRKYMDPLTEKNIHFAILEKSKATLEMRKTLKIGLNMSIDQEFVIIENSCMTCDLPTDNYKHGNPKKYRMTDLTNEANVKKFFEDYHAGTLPTYWASLEEGQKKKKVKRNSQYHLSAWNFEEFIYNTDSLVGVYVAFFNDDPKHECEHCKRGREVWTKVAKEMELKKKEFRHLIMATIDQSANEHPENLVPGKLAAPMVVWYPPGTPEQRRKKKQILHSWSTPPSKFTEEGILENIRDMIEQMNEDREEL